MRHRLGLLALTVAASAVHITPALAAARLVTPTGGRATSSFPLLRWSLPRGEETEVVYIARRRTRTGAGEFLTANLEDTGPLSGRTQRYRSVNGLYSGTHYWLVVTRDPNFNQRFSRVGRFRVVEMLSVARLHTVPGATPRRLDVRMRVRTNARLLRFTIRVVQRGRVVQVVTGRARVRDPGVSGTRTVHWLASSAVARGEPATLRVTVTAGTRTYRARRAITAP